MPIVVPILKNNTLIGLLNILDKTILDLKNSKKNWVLIEVIMFYVVFFINLIFKKNSEYENLYNKNWENLLLKFSENDEDFEKILLLSENVLISDVKKGLVKVFKKNFFN